MHLLSQMLPQQFPSLIWAINDVLKKKLINWAFLFCAPQWFKKEAVHSKTYSE